MSRVHDICRSSRSFPALALAALLTFASIAGGASAAKKFDPSNKKIVVNKSIAGVKLGQSIDAAKNAWNGDASCHPKGDAAACQWGSEGRGGFLSFIYARGIDDVFQVSIIASAKHGQNVFRKPLTTVKTSKGIGLGSKRSAVKRAYPGGSSETYQYLIVRGKVSTNFQFTADRRVSSITIEREFLARP